MVLLHAWPDATTWQAGRRRMEGMPSLQEAFTAQRQSAGTPSFLRAEVNLLEPAPGMTIRAGLGWSAEGPASLAR